jgi:hypothetical protein
MTRRHQRVSVRRDGVASLVLDRGVLRTCYGALTVAAFGFVGALVLGLVH